MNTSYTSHILTKSKTSRVIAAVIASLALVVASLGLARPVSALECIRAPHTVTVDQASQNATPGQVVYFNFTITNHDSEGCGTSDFTFDTANKPADWAVAPYNGTEHVDYGEITGYSVWYTVPTDVYNQSYTFPVEIYRAEEPTVVTVPVQINVTGGKVWTTPTNPTPTTPPAPAPDTSAPVVSLVSPTTSSTVRKNTTVTLNATASDNVAVTKIAFYVNGVLLCEGDATACAWKVPNTKATYLIEVKAFDLAGNVGTASASVNAR